VAFTSGRRIFEINFAGKVNETFVMQNILKMVRYLIIII